MQVIFFHTKRIIVNLLSYFIQHHLLKGFTYKLINFNSPLESGSPYQNELTFNLF